MAKDIRFNIDENVLLSTCGLADALGKVRLPEIEGSVARITSCVETLLNPMESIKSQSIYDLLENPIAKYAVQFEFPHDNGNEAITNAERPSIPLSYSDYLKQILEYSSNTVPASQHKKEVTDAECRIPVSQLVDVAIAKGNIEDINSLYIALTQQRDIYGIPENETEDFNKQTNKLLEHRKTLNNSQRPLISNCSVYDDKVYTEKENRTLTPEEIKEPVQTTTAEAGKEVQPQTLLGKAILKMQEKKIITKQSDYAWLYLALNQLNDMPDFHTPKSFIDYLKGDGLTGLPDETTIRRSVKKVDGDYPNWEFSDADETITQRRIKVVGYLKMYYKDAAGTLDESA